MERAGEKAREDVFRFLLGEVDITFLLAIILMLVLKYIL
jgi:hypothetical protein